MLRPGVTVIGTVHAMTRDPDRFGVELRLSSLLSAADLEPVGLAPSAIVCIRSISARHPRRAPSEWSAEVRKSIEDSIRAADRPAERQPPPSSKAIVFADTAEMLACMLADAANASLALRWWWRSLLRGAWLTADVVSRRWSETPTCVPAAVEYLVRGGSVAALSALEEPYLVLMSVMRAFGLALLERAVPSRLESNVPLSMSTSVADEREVAKAANVPRPRTTAPPPWRKWVPSRLEAGLTVDQRTLLGIGTVIFRAPEVARGAAFAEAVAKWCSSTADVLAGVHPDDHSGPEELTPVQHPIPSVTAAAQRGFRGTELITAMAPEETSTPPPPAGPEEQPLRGAPSETQRSAAAGDVVDAAIGEEVLAEAPGVPLEELVADTEFGGLFYLLNVALRLGFYPDFTRPADPCIPLGPWDFLAAVGQRLLGDEVRVDPVCRLLITLGGHPESENPLADLDGDLVTDLTRQVRTYLVDELGLTIDVVCRARGRILATAISVDVLLALAELPIEIRRIGLDRDLGWWPVAGRSIAFHFN